VSHMTGTDILIFLGLLDLLLFLKTRIRIRNRIRIQKIEGLDPDPEKVIRIRNTATLHRNTATFNERWCPN